MQAIRLVTPRQLEIADIAEPQPGPEDVLVEVHFVGMCGSDLNAYRGTFPLMRYPRVLGHEASGIVVARGAAVPDRIAEGARVMFSPYSECGICPSCRAGRPNCCQFNETMGLQRDGALTRVVAMHYSKVFTSDTLTLQELALTEPLSVGYHAANRGRISEADTVLVMGCGVVGIGVIAAAARKGATVIASDIDDGKLADAQRFGARHIVNSTHKDVLDTVRELTG
ncbi:MAG TPA: alcohol dehydrogenase catalytic domain-containing protein, partial [Anaerolineae bacterium]|nr:alcohol dehydrogenase catalytic domain-containing protein [Anaerolineae bacterium]